MVEKMNPTSYFNRDNIFLMMAFLQLGFWRDARGLLGKEDFMFEVWKLWWYIEMGLNILTVTLSKGIKQGGLEIIEEVVVPKKGGNNNWACVG